MIILETNSVSLGEVLVDGEVVAEDADATDLTRVPAARHQNTCRTCCCTPSSSVHDYA